MLRRWVLLGVLMGSGCPQARAGGSSALLERMRSTQVKAGPLLPVSKEKFELLTFAMEMGIAMAFPTCDNMVSSAAHPVCISAFYGDEPIYREDPTGVDAILLLDVGAYCFVTWRGSVAPDITSAVAREDWLYRNADTESRTAERLDGQGQCPVLEGMLEAYQGGELEAAELEPDIISFVETCMAAPDKQLVLTGHSQGAGAAVVGAVRFAGYNPLTLALAGPATVKSPSNACAAINPDHMWRVINSEIDLETHELKYDAVPYSNIVPIARQVLGEQIGASIHLPPDIPNPTNEENPMATPITFSHDQHNLAYFSKDQIKLEETYGPSTSDLSMGNSVNFGVHIMYLPKMHRMLEHGSFPLDVTGYVPGTPCTGDAECQFMCIDNVCAADGAALHPDGAACVAHDDCESGDCSGCLLNVGSDWCCTAGDADHGATPNGEACRQDGNCQSDRCTWDYICEDKLENGASCSAMHMNDGDCASGACSYSRNDGWRCVPTRSGGNAQIA